MKELKQSETITILRSQINLNPYNPKNHSDEQVKKQLKNLKKVGYIGGIKWNKVTGNLIDGHRRIKALDLYHKYDGSAEKDYSVKVEAVEFDEKTEKEQMTYEALGNTKADYNLVAEYIHDIDYKEIGLSDEDLTAILSLTETEAVPIIDTLDDFILPSEDIEIEIKTKEQPKQEQNETDNYQERKEAVKEMKEQIRENAIERQRNENAYLTLSFSTHEAKSIFCELLNIGENENFAKGEEVLMLIE